MVIFFDFIMHWIIDSDSTNYRMTSLVYSNSHDTIILNEINTCQTPQQHQCMFNRKTGHRIQIYTHLLLVYHAFDYCDCLTEFRKNTHKKVCM